LLKPLTAMAGARAVAAADWPEAVLRVAEAGASGMKLEVAGGNSGMLIMDDYAE
jgi:hypothetical protein